MSIYHECKDWSERVVRTEISAILVRIYYIDASDKIYYKDYTKIYILLYFVLYSKLKGKIKVSLIRDCTYTEKLFGILINQLEMIIYTIFRLIWNQTDVRLVPNHPENAKYNPILI